MGRLDPSNYLTFNSPEEAYPMKKRLSEMIVIINRGKTYDGKKETCNV